MGALLLKKRERKGAGRVDGFFFGFEEVHSGGIPLFMLKQKGKEKKRKGWAKDVINTHLTTEKERKKKKTEKIDEKNLKAAKFSSFFFNLGGFGFIFFTQC